MPLNQEALYPNVASGRSLGPAGDVYQLDDGAARGRGDEVIMVMVVLQVVVVVVVIVVLMLVVSGNE